MDKRPPIPIVRLAHPLGFRTYLHRVGVNPDPSFRKCGLPTLCDDPSAYVPLHRAWRFFAWAAGEMEPSVGWKVGKFVGDHQLSNGLLQRLESSTTLLQALRMLVVKARTESTEVLLQLRNCGSDLLMCTSYPGLRDDPVYQVSQAYQIRVYVELIRHFLGRNWQPEVIGLEGIGTERGVDEFLPYTDVRVRQPSGYIAIPRRLLQQPACYTAMPITRSEPSLSDECVGFVETLQALVSTYMQQGYVSEQLASELMETSTRTVSRRLAERDQTYAAMLDDIRFRKARELLSETDMPILEVANAVGVSDQGNFNRLIRRIGGVTPKQLRDSARENPDDLH